VFIESAIALQQLHCNKCTATTTLQRLQQDTLQPDDSRASGVFIESAIALQQLHCNKCTATTTLQRLQQDALQTVDLPVVYTPNLQLLCNCSETTSLQQLHCNNFTATTSLQQLHYNN